MAQIFTRHNNYFAFGRDTHEVNQIIPEEVVFSIPIYAYVHGGVVVKASMNGNPFSCPWDSGQCGVVIATRNDIRQQFGAKRISKRMLREMPQIMIDQVEELNHMEEEEL